MQMCSDPWVLTEGQKVLVLCQFKKNNSTCCTASTN